MRNREGNREKNRMRNRERNREGNRRGMMTFFIVVGILFHKLSPYLSTVVRQCGR